jgi:signal transduction histidine kinase
MWRSTLKNVIRMEQPGFNPDFKLFFESSPGLYLVLSTDLTILAATDAYLKATLTERDQIVGRYLFDIFPDNPDDNETTAVDNMRASIGRVIKKRAPDRWADQRHDVRRPSSEGGGFVTRYWRPTNYPLFDPKGDIKYILHTVVNSTEFVRLQEKGAEELAKYTRHLEKVNNKLSSANRELSRQYKELLKKDSRIDGLTSSNEVHEEVNRQLNLINAELAKAKERAEESDLLKSAFLANISHEIRTPLNGMLGFTEILKEPGLTTPEQQKYIDIIEKSGQRLLDTVQDLIDISKIETGQVIMNISEVNLEKQIENLYEFFKPQAEQKNLRLILRNLIPSEYEIIETDRAKLDSVLTNLLRNAIKFTNKGKIEIGCTISGNYVDYYVDDTGIGIPQSEHEAVFIRFQQADTGNGTAIQGSGLGLAIAKAYVEMLGGEIWLESEVGHGSTFHFKIKRNFEGNGKSPRNEKKYDANQGVPLFRNKKLLIAEDDDFSREMMVYLLEKTGCEILVARDGPEAVEIFSNTDVDLVLLDIRLPGMNGYDVLREMQSRIPNTPVIAQTAYAMVDDIKKMKEAGFTDHIIKPVGQQQLYRLLSKYMELSV